MNFWDSVNKKKKEKKIKVQPDSLEITGHTPERLFGLCMNSDDYLLHFTPIHKMITKYPKKHKQILLFKVVYTPQ